MIDKMPQPAWHDVCKWLGTFPGRQLLAHDPAGKIKASEMAFIQRLAQGQGWGSGIKFISVFGDWWPVHLQAPDLWAAWMAESEGRLWSI